MTGRFPSQRASNAEKVSIDDVLMIAEQHEFFTVSVHIHFIFCFATQLLYLPWDVETIMAFSFSCYDINLLL